MSNKDIRWHQRFNSFSKAYFQLQKFIDKSADLNEMEEQGLIQAFEYNFELSWNLIKDYYEYQGETEIQGSRDAFRLAYKRGLIKDGSDWMKMIESRVKTSHTYNKETADEITFAIINIYFNLFTDLHQSMSNLLKNNSDSNL